MVSLIFVASPALDSQGENSRASVEYAVRQLNLDLTGAVNATGSPEFSSALTPGFVLTVEAGKVTSLQSARTASKGLDAFTLRCIRFALLAALFSPAQETPAAFAGSALLNGETFIQRPAR